MRSSDLCSDPAFPDSLAEVQLDRCGVERRPVAHARGRSRGSIEWRSFEITLQSVGGQSLTVEPCRIEFRTHDEPLIAIEQRGRSRDEDAAPPGAWCLHGDGSTVMPPPPGDNR